MLFLCFVRSNSHRMSHKGGFSSTVPMGWCPSSLWCQKHHCWSECSRGSESISQVALIDQSVCSLANPPTAAQMDRARCMVFFYFLGPPVWWLVWKLTVLMCIHVCAGDKHMLNGCQGHFARIHCSGPDAERGTVWDTKFQDQVGGQVQFSRRRRKENTGEHTEM